MLSVTYMKRVNLFTMLCFKCKDSSPRVHMMKKGTMDFSTLFKNVVIMHSNGELSPLSLEGAQLEMRFEVLVTLQQVQRLARFSLFTNMWDLQLTKQKHFLHISESFCFLSSFRIGRKRILIPGSNER